MHLAVRVEALTARQQLQEGSLKGVQLASLDVVLDLPLLVRVLGEEHLLVLDRQRHTPPLVVLAQLDAVVPFHRHVYPFLLQQR